MPITGTGPVLGAALMAAVDQVVAPSLASHQAPDRLAIYTAMANAILLHLSANGLIVGTATGVTVGAAAVPVLGTIT